MAKRVNFKYTSENMAKEQAVYFLLLLTSALILAVQCAPASGDPQPEAEERDKRFIGIIAKLIGRVIG
ncbi:Hypothetical predicted protein [Cloeon dipterum]|uniref:Uncharacterized protein n=1 Tax=Cloeon dipterum TaxID=197152 RepID=A0A8S1BUM5_9INSE|nr:Hypothetical predicted protein [Cloeon dipterum]